MDEEAQIRSTAALLAARRWAKATDEQRRQVGKMLAAARAKARRARKAKWGR